MNYFKKRKTAFAAALSGLTEAFKSEAHLKIHGIAALLVINAGFYFGVSKTDWIVLLGCITLVVSLELVNSALEKLCDLVMPGQHVSVKYIKDVAAGAVLVACVFSVIAGILVFGRYVRFF